MDLPFTGFELTFIIIAFFIFSLFSLASICIQSEEAPAGTYSPPPLSVRSTHTYTKTNVSFSKAAHCMSALFQRKTSMKQGSHDHLTKSKEWSSSKLARNRKGKVGDFCLGLPGSQCTENLFQMTHMLQSQFEGICNSPADHKAVIVWFVMTAATMDNMSDNRSEGSRFSSWLAPCELGLACTSFLLSLICYTLHLLPSWSLFCLWYYSFFSCNSCFGNLYR